MSEPTGWLYRFLHSCIKLSVEKYPNDRKKWLGAPGASRMKLWALVLQKQGVLQGNLSALDQAGEGLTLNYQKAFNDSIWPWEVDRVARQVLEHHPEFDAFPDQRRAKERQHREPIELAPYVAQAKQRQLERVQRPGQHETIRIIVPKKNDLY